MELAKLPKITRRSKKRLGIGEGSGRGKTSGRGTKGQKARGKVKFGFEGGQLALTKRLPLRRGRGRNVSFRKNPFGLNVKFLNFLKPNAIVDVQSLLAQKIIAKGEEKYGVKILGEGEVKIPLTVKLPCSKGAAKKIIEAGGKVVND
ncbi:50S ribosomal protein L15 [Candidatus Microgenomates bacterium]|nr:50S ribosomal protein L15 [Candidatus Microgenomates bacterium]